VGPVVDEAFRRVLLGISRGADHPEDEGGERDDRKRRRPPAKATLALAERASLRAGCTGGLARRWILPSPLP
jgi:hypothetical protein